MSEKKFTKKEVLGFIADLAKGTENEVAISEYVEKELTTMANRAKKDEERRLQKRAEGDAFQAEVLSIITPDYQTIDDVLAAYRAKFGKSVNQQAVVAKIRNLVDTDQVIKEKVKTPEGGARMAYRLA